MSEMGLEQRLGHKFITIRLSRISPVAGFECCECCSVCNGKTQVL